MSNTEVAREREIPHQMDDIQEALDKLDIACAGLRDRLVMTLKDDLVSPKDTEAEKEKLVPMAASLKLICDRINATLSTIGYLSEACEL